MKPLLALTSLRFFAALSILIFHATQFAWLGAVKFEFLAQGVSFFFVLSGFILTYSCGGRRPKLFDFYVKRVARIWPVHLVTFAASLLFPTLIGTLFSWNAVQSILLVQAWIPISSHAFAFNSVSWSISVELFFYILFPFLFLPHRANFLMIIFLFLLSFISVLVVSHYSQEASQTNWGSFYSTFFYANPVSRLSEFILGVVTGLLFMRYSGFKMPSWAATIFELISILSILFLAYFVQREIKNLHDTQYISYWLRFNCGAPAFAMILFLFAFSRGLFSIILSRKTFIVLGNMSYSLYMSHVMVILALEKLNIDEIPNIYVRAILLFSSCLFVAFFIWRFIEVPARKVIVQACLGRRLIST